MRVFILLILFPHQELSDRFRDHNRKYPKVQVSDVPSSGYCLASFSTMKVPEKSGLFQPISIPLHCLKRVHAVGTAAFSYMNSNTESSTEEGAPINPIDECRNIMELYTKHF